MAELLHIDNQQNNSNGEDKSKQISSAVKEDHGLPNRRAEAGSSDSERPAVAAEGESETKKPTVLDAEDIGRMVPFLGRHPRLTNWLMRVIRMDRVNALHANNCRKSSGAEVVRGMLHDLDITVVAENGEVLRNLPEGAFVTVSNHHFGALDGIILIDLIARRRPKYKVMVNMFLNYIWAMRPNFIAVDQQASADPKKKAVSMQGIKEAIRLVRQGEPVGFFPAGAVGKINWRGRLQDRQWQDSVIRLIQQMKVPVVPIFFHGSQSWFFNIMGVLWWQFRTILHPEEVFRKRHKTFTVTVGDPISVEEQQAHNGSIKEFGDFLRAQTYGLRDDKEMRSRAKLVTPPDGVERIEP